MSVQNQYNDNDYKNWLRACLGLKYLKEGILDFIDAEVKQLHATIITNVCGSRSCSQCTTNHVTKTNHRCPNNVCNIIRQEIERSHRFPRPCWQNTDATKWCADYWEIGKCFMSPGYATKSTAAETDCSGLLSICINGVFLPPTLTGQIVLQCIPAGPPLDIFHKNREARNAILHSGSMSLSDAERQAYIQDMIILLTCYKQPIDQATQAAIDKLTQLNTNIFITSIDELEVLKTKLEAIGSIQNDVQTAISEIGELKTKAADNQRNIHDASSKLDTLKSQMDRSETAIQNTEGDIGALKTQMDRSETAIQNTEGDIGALKTKMDCHQTDMQSAEVKMQSAEVKIGTLEAKVAETVNTQRDLKRDVEEQWQRQKTDTCRIETQIKNNSDSLALVGDKLDKLQCNIDEGVTEMKTACQAKNEIQNKEIADLKSCIDVQGRLHETRIGKVEDEVTELRKDLDATREAIRPENTAPDKQQQIQDVKDYLVAKYKRDELTIPMSPVLRRISANVDDVYIELTIRDDLVHKPKPQMKDKYIERQKTRHRKSGRRQGNVHSYLDVLYDDQTSCQNIYVVGNAGVGKSTWSRKFVATWVRAMENRGTYNVLNENETVLQEYDLVFYISLRHARGDTHIMEMIEHQLFPPEPDLFAITKTLLNNTDVSSRCIVMLDGLDEWCSHEHLSSSGGLPLRDPRWKAAIITTTRSWKLEALQLEAGKIQRAIEIQGLLESGVERLIAHIVSTLNRNMGAHKDVANFQTQSRRLMKDCMRVPLLLTIFVCIWYENDELSNHLAGIYSELVNLLIQCVEGNTKTQQFQKVLPQNLHEMKENWKKQKCSVPDCLQYNDFLVSYLPFLLRLGKLAFKALFADTKEETLVFDYRSIETVLHEDELDVSVNIGLLSQTIQPESVLEQKFTLSFLHKTVQEYLAALYMVCGDSKSECLNRYKTYCTDVYRILEMENILLFLSGLCPETASEMQCHIAGIQAGMPIIDRHMPFANMRDNTQAYEQMRELMLRCFREEQAVSDYLSTATSKDNILYAIAIGKYFKPISGWSVIKRLVFKWSSGADNSPSEIFRKLVFKLSSGADRVPIDTLNQPVLCQYSPSTQFKSDKFGCEVLRTEQYQLYSGAIRVPTESLKEVSIVFCYSPSTESSLDMSGCKVLRKLQYKWSSIAIQLPTKTLEEVVIEYYRPSTESVLDMSECKVLRKLTYKSSFLAIRLPTESLEEVVIHDYRPSTESVLDMSGCKTLRKLEYTESSVAIRLPTKNLKEVVIDLYRPSTESVLDMSGCKVLRKLEYTWSSAAIRLPTESLEEVVILCYSPSTESVLDMSGCKVLRRLVYNGPSTAIRVPNRDWDGWIRSFYTIPSIQDFEIFSIFELCVPRLPKYTHLCEPMTTTGYSRIPYNWYRNPRTDPEHFGTFIEHTQDIQQLL